MHRTAQDAVKSVWWIAVARAEMAIGAQLQTEAALTWNPIKKWRLRKEARRRWENARELLLRN